MKTIALIGAASVALAACASSPVPADRLAKSQAAIRSAHEMGAEKNPTAALHLRVANDGLALGRKLINEGDNKRAGYVLMRAESDAEAAIAIAQESEAREEAQRTLYEIQKLKSSSSRQEGS